MNEDLSKHFDLRLTEDLFKDIKAAADTEYLSINRWCLLRLTEAVKNHQHNREILSGVQIRPDLLAKLQPAQDNDLDLIVQKRGKTGKFEKRGKGDGKR